MHLDEREVRGGWLWLAFSGFLAIALGVFLYYADNYLTYSDAEERHGNMLRELRTAQATISPGVSDLRQIVSSTSTEISSEVAEDNAASEEDAEDKDSSGEKN